MQDPAFTTNSSGINSQSKPNSWLFITARPDQRETLRPFLSAWIDIAINALMVMYENQQCRLWFIMDELTALQKLPRLHAGPAEGRKYGECIIPTELGLLKDLEAYIKLPGDYPITTLQCKLQQPPAQRKHPSS